MSIEKTMKGEWRVRWREGGRNRARVIGTRSEALLFDAELRRKKRLGDLALMDAGQELTGDFAREWFTEHAATHLELSTRRTYAGMWDAHLLHRIGAVPLRELTPERCDRLATDLARAGIGPAARRKSLVLLQSILTRAELWGRIRSNPMRAVRKPSQTRQRQIQPLPPSVVETIRAILIGSDRTWDAVLISVLAYAGLRPGEALALRWEDIGEQTIRVDRAAANGVVKSTKTGASRSVRLLAPLKGDLAEWRLRCGRPGPATLVFPRPDGGLLATHDWQNWRRRVFKPAVRAAGRPAAVPYDCRHSFVSLLIQEGKRVTEVAQQAGHSPALSLRTYAHVFEEFEGCPPRSAEALIRAARGAHVPAEYLAAEEGTTASAEEPAQ